MRKLAADRRRDLGYLLGRTTESVESRHERGMQARGDRQRWGRNGSKRPLGGGACFQHCLGHLLHEQGDTVGTLDDVMLNSRIYHHVPADELDHCTSYVLVQSVDSEFLDVRPSNPRRVEFWP